MARDRDVWLNAVENTLSTLRRTHLFIVLAGAAIVFLSIPSGPDYQAAHGEVTALRTALSDEAFGAHCAEIVLQEYADWWSASRSTVETVLGRADLPPDLLVKGFVDCDRPRLDESLESYRDFLLGAIRPLYWDAPPEEVAVALTRIGGNPADLVELEFWLRPRDVRSAADLSFQGRPVSVGFVDGLSYSTDSLSLGVRFETSAASAYRTMPVRGDLRMSYRRTTVLDWLSEEGLARNLSEGSGEDLVLLPSLQRFWDAIGALTPTEAAQYLEGRIQDQAASVEVMGVGLSTTMLGWAGPLVLLILALLMSGHSRHLGRLVGHQAEPVATYPWMALFDDPVSKVATWCSLLALPSASSALVALRTLSGSWVAAIWAAGIAVLLFGLNWSLMGRISSLRRLVVASA